MPNTRRKIRRKTRKSKKRWGKVLGIGRFGCVIQPPSACIPGKNMSQFVGKLVSSKQGQQKWDRSFKELYPLLINEEFEAYQLEFPTEWEKAEEIRRRIPTANDLFVLPTESCPITNLTSENVVNCRTRVSENLNTQLILPFAEGNLRELLESEKHEIPKKGLLEALEEVKQSIDILHTNRIIHNDIKLENILWGFKADGGLWCKLADFGIALIFPTRDDETLTTRIEESARSSLSSNSYASISPVPRAPTPVGLVPPLLFPAKKGLVPSLALGRVLRSPRPNTSRSPVLVDTEFESMKGIDSAALNDVMKLVGV